MHDYTDVGGRALLGASAEDSIGRHACGAGREAREVAPADSGILGQARCEH